AVLGLLLALVNPNARKPILITLGTLLVISVGAVLLIGFLRFLEPNNWLILLLFALAGIALFGLVALIVVNPKTRPWGIGLAIVGPMVVVLPLGAFFVMSVRTVRSDFGGYPSLERVHEISQPVVPVELDADIHSPDNEATPAATADNTPAEEPTIEETPAAASSDETTTKTVNLVETAEEPKRKTTVPAKPSEKPASPPETTTEDRPPWVDAPPRKVGDVYRMTVNVGPYETRLDCDRQLPERIQAAADDYVDRYLGPEVKGRVRLPADYLEKNTVRETWEETREYSVGPMTHLHVLLEFDRKTNDLIKQQWRDAQVRERIVQAGTALGGVLTVLLAAFGLLKFDLATGGAYRKHMAIGAILLLLALVIGGWWLIPGSAGF
ncbi:MAG: hypothetical protein GX621_08065, partial [Pirellulaceae bacterium]|nr:hypothetical protein [Pirellulaceae bacterium]